MLGEKSSRWGDALHILAEAIQCQEADSVSFSAAMSACEKGTRWDFALELLSQMHGQKHHSTFVQYGSLLTSCRLASAWQQALMLLKASATFDAVCLTHVLYTFEDAGHWTGTLPVLRSLRHQLLPQMEFASRTDPGATAALRAHAASTGSLEICQSYGNDSSMSSRLERLRARVRCWAFQELGEMRHGSAANLEYLCDFGRPCTQDALEQFSFAEELRWHSMAASMARLLGDQFDSPQAAASRLGVSTHVQLGDLPELVEVTMKQKLRDCFDCF